MPYNGTGGIAGGIDQHTIHPDQVSHALGDGVVLVAGGNGCDCDAVHLHCAVLTVHQHISRTVQDGAWFHGEQLQLVVVVVLMGDEDDVLPACHNHHRHRGPHREPVPSSAVMR